MSGKKLFGIVSAFIFSVFGCNLGGITNDPPLTIAFAAGDPAEYYGSVGAVRVSVTAENPVDVDWSLEWKDEDVGLPLEDYFRICPLAYRETMSVDLVCYSLTEHKAEISAWIHGAPHTKITKTVRAPDLHSAVTKGIDTIVMPPFTGSRHPLFPECETAVEIVKLTQDMLLSVTPAGSPTDGFLRLVEQDMRHSYVFEIADPEGQPEITMQNVLSTLYVVLDPGYTGYFRGLQALPIEGLKSYLSSDGFPFLISGIQVDESGKRLTITISSDYFMGSPSGTVGGPNLTEEEEKAFFAALQIPVLASAELYSLISTPFGSTPFGSGSGLKGRASELRTVSAWSGSGSYNSLVSTEQGYVCTRNENARCVRAGGQFPQTLTILTQDTSDGFAYLGDKLFLEAMPGNARTVANGRTYALLYSAHADSELSDANETVISGSRKAFRRVFAMYLTTAAQKYAAAHGLYSAPVRFGSYCANELSDFELKDDLKIVYGCVRGRDSALMEEILTDAAAQLNALLLADGEGYKVSLEKKEYDTCEALTAAAGKGGIDLRLGTYEDVARGRFKYYERYIDWDGLDWGWNVHVTEDMGDLAEAGWYDDELPLFDTQTESEGYIGVYETYLFDAAVDVPLFLGEDVYRLPKEGDGCGYDAFLTQYRGYSDLIAQGWTGSDQGLRLYGAEGKP